MLNILKIGDRVEIITDNVNYEDYIGMELEVTEIVSDEPEDMFYLQTMDGEHVPFAFYESELDYY